MPILDKVSVNNVVYDLSVATDKTLSVENKAADAKAVGDKITTVKADLSKSVSDLKSAVNPLEEVVNFQIELNDLGTKKNFHVVSGDVVTVRAKDGSAMTPTQLRLVRQNNSEDYWTLSGHTKRVITMTEEFVKAFVYGGTAQDIIVTTTGSYLNFQPQIDETNAAITTAKIYTLGVLGNKSSEIMPVTIYNGYKQKTGNGYFNADGTVTENASWQYCSDFIPIMPNASYSAWSVDSYSTAKNALILWYSIDKVLISRSNNAITFTSPANAYYCKISIKDSGSQPMFISGTTNPRFYRPYSIKFANDTDSVAERNIQNVSNGNLPILNSSYNYEDISVTEEDGYINYAGYLHTANKWKHIEVNVEGGNTYYFEGSSASGCYAMLIFDDYQLIQTIPASLGSGSYSQNVKMPGNAKRVIINKSSTGIVLKKAVSISLASKNILNGKKLYCGGDSITEAVNVGSFPNGYKKSYAGYVANRNNMVYVSDGIGGSCMGNVMIDGWNYNAFCVNRYQNIPTDADYITLWFGWNDNAYGWKSMREAYCVETYGAYYSALTETQKAEVDAYKTWRQWLADYVGTVDSTSDKTWSGAWSKVLTWLLDNCPSSRIGVIVAYGMHEELSTALIAICEKYGVSYVKTYDPHEFFSVGHSHGIGEDQAVKRKQLYTLDNTHPNELGYEMMSTSYEKFLRGL